jgi:CHAT domain-containing protein/tetratricopeptide (TPR) repeat protein
MPFDLRSRRMKIICLLLLSAGGNTVPAQEPEAVILQPGQTIERELAGGQKHIYQINLGAGLFFSAEVEQKIDVTVKVSDPAGQPLFEADNPHGTALAEQFALVSAAPGFYRLEIRASDPAEKANTYKLKTEPLRAATDEDRSRAEAEKLLHDAVAAIKKRNAEGYSLAAANLLQALPVYQKSGDKRREQYVYDRLGRVANDTGEKGKALQYKLRALELAQGLNDPALLAITVDNLATGYFTIGDRRKAIEYWQQSLEMFRALKNRRAELIALNNIASAQGSLGERGKSLDTYLQLVEILRERNDERVLASVYTSIGSTLYSIGDREKCFEYFAQGLALARKIKNKAQETFTLTQIGFVHANLGNHEQALEHCRLAVQLSQEAGNKLGQANNLNTIGYIYLQKGELASALETLRQVEELQKQIQNRALEATVSYQIGLVYYELKEYSQAAQHFQRARDVAREIENGSMKSRSEFMLAEVAGAQGRPTEARSQMESVLQYLETMRRRLGQQDRRSTYFASVQRLFEYNTSLLVDLHRQKGDPEAAEAAYYSVERSRARSLLDSLAEARVDIKQGADPALLEREKELQRRINDSAAALTLLLSSRHTEAQKAEAVKNLEELRQEYESVQSQLAATGPRYLALTQPAPLTAKEVQQQVLDRDTTLLEYSLGEKRSFLFALTQDSLQVFELPARAQIEKQARRFYELLTARNLRVKFETAEEKRARVAQADAALNAAAAGLSQTVLAPAAGLLARKRLLIVTDGALQYVPFAALPAANQQPLLASAEIVNLPSASTLAGLRRELKGRPPAPKAVTIFADPVFAPHDGRFQALAAKNGDAAKPVALAAARGADELTRAVRAVAEEETVLNLARLPFTRQEADGIAALAPAGQRRAALGFAANRQAVANPKLSQYRIVHFATHSFVSSAHPDLSGIVLSLIDEQGQPQDGFLRANDIYNLKLPAELIVLSGCKTGLGKEIRGEGLVGLTRGFMYAGAARVAVSLWDVNDAATAELMQRFYRQMLGSSKQTPAAALRAAQLALRQDQRWASPYYWAAFTLQGEPR